MSEKFVIISTILLKIYKLYEVIFKFKEIFENK